MCAESEERRRIQRQKSAINTGIKLTCPQCKQVGNPLTHKNRVSTILKWKPKSEDTLKLTKNDSSDRAPKKCVCVVAGGGGGGGGANHRHSTSHAF